MSAGEQPGLAEYLEGAFARTGATRTDLLRSAMNAWAPQPVVEQLLTLPEGYYRSVEEVLTELR